MGFFEFATSEWVSENFKVHMSIEPIGTKYQYKLTFDDGISTASIDGITHTPYGSILDLRSHLLSIMDTLADSIEDVKIAAADIESQENYSEEDNYEDDENGESSGI